MSRADTPRYPFSRCFFVPLTRRGHSTSISEVSANADGDEGLTEMASAMQSSASRLMTRCEMSPPLERQGMGLSARPLRCCLFIESPTLPFYYFRVTVDTGSRAGARETHRWSLSYIASSTHIHTRRHFHYRKPLRLVKTARGSRQRTVKHSTNTPLSGDASLTRSLTAAAKHAKLSIAACLNNRTCASRSTWPCMHAPPAR